jgi:hypothetical protein
LQTPGRGADDGDALRDGGADGVSVAEDDGDGAAGVCDAEDEDDALGDGGADGDSVAEDDGDGAAGVCDAVGEDNALGAGGADGVSVAEDDGDGAAGVFDAVGEDDALRVGEGDLLDDGLNGIMGVREGEAVADREGLGLGGAENSVIHGVSKH